MFGSEPARHVRRARPQIIPDLDLGLAGNPVLVGGTLIPKPETDGCRVDGLGDLSAEDI
ncbi:unnamed protein product, partial [Allacma fusca]